MSSARLGPKKLLAPVRSWSVCTDITIQYRALARTDPSCVETEYWFEWALPFNRFKKGLLVESVYQIRLLSCPVPVPDPCHYVPQLSQIKLAQVLCFLQRCS